MRRRVDDLLARMDLTTTGSREDFESLVEDAFVGIVALQGCSPADIAWLNTAFGHGHCAPSCILVTPHSIARFLRLRHIRSSRLHVVWAEDAEGMLRRILHRIEPWHRDPLRLLGHRLLTDSPPRGSLARAIDRICCVFAPPRPEPPPRSVADLARGVALHPDTLRHHWRNGLPLRCGPKQLLAWALLFWSIRRRVRTGWDDLARQAGVRRRTLERAGGRLAGCTLSELAGDPEGVRRRFRGWVRERSPPHGMAPGTGAR